MTEQEFDDLMENGDNDMEFEYYNFIADNHPDIHHFNIEGVMQRGDYYDDFKDYYLKLEAA